MRVVRVTPPKKHWRGKVWPVLHISRMLPSVVTIGALCMGLTAIHFAFLHQWQHAVASVLIAGVLDGIDGRLARFLNSSTEFGAELDSLADFINFGVAPALILYFFSLHVLPGLGWGLCLFFSSCMALRLARFNVQRGLGSGSVFSVGVPAPAGALLALLPMITGFVGERSHIPPIFPVLSVGISALLTVSRYPTFIFKKMTIKHDKKGLFLIGMVVTISSVLTAPWETLLFIGLLYVVSLPISGYVFYSFKKQHL